MAPMPESNVRFLIVWAALVPVLATVAALVPALDLAPWSNGQTHLVVAEVNAASAVVLALVAYVWAHSVKEPAALQGSVAALTVATITLGAGFGWWNLTDEATQLVVTLVAGVVIVVLAAFGRSVAYAPETVEIEKARAATPEALEAAIAARHSSS